VDGKSWKGDVPGPELCVPHDKRDSVSNHGGDVVSKDENDVGVRVFDLSFVQLEAMFYSPTPKMLGVQTIFILNFIVRLYRLGLARETPKNVVSSETGRLSNHVVYF
jgi:hypothetical protein